MILQPKAMLFYFSIGLGGVIALLPAAYGAGRPTPPVVTAKVERSPLSDRLEALGTLRANESVELSAKVTDVVEEIGFHDGQRVEKGAVLVKMSSSEEEALLTEARSTANEARQQYERSKQLAKQGATALSQLDEARRVFETSNARLVAIESRLKDLVVTAPFQGIVGLRNISVGALVQPGELITTIDDDSVMKLDFAVPTTFLKAVSPGTPVEARVPAYEGKIFKGNISSVGSRIDPVTRTVVVRAELPNPERLLKPGLLMTVELLSNQREAILIPEEALLPIGRKSTVFVVAEGDGDPRVHRREVVPGARREGQVEILEGLEEGEVVVTRGAGRAVDGEAVRIVALDSGGDSLPQLLENEAGN